jgi:hypothetical protein
MSQYLQSFSDGAKVLAIKLGYENGACVYEIKFEGFDMSELVKVTSISGKETINANITIDNNSLMYHLPGTLTENSGINRMIYTRNSGEYVELLLPWDKQ